MGRSNIFNQLDLSGYRTRKFWKIQEYLNKEALIPGRNFHSSELEMCQWRLTTEWMLITWAKKFSLIQKSTYYNILTANQNILEKRKKLFVLREWWVKFLISTFFKLRPWFFCTHNHDDMVKFYFCESISFWVINKNIRKNLHNSKWNGSLNFSVKCQIIFARPVAYLEKTSH